MTVREREKVVDERVVRRTEEISCPITGQPKLQTIEYVEKVIETEVRRTNERTNESLNSAPRINH